jgi:5,10-methylenetetrahydromethanopterin reductase
MRFSVRFNNDLPVAEYPRLAAAAEAAGFDQFWVSDDLFLRGVWPILSACVSATSRIELGTCIVNPYTMHPAEIAMQAAALDELSGGRFNLGIAAGAADFLGWVGIRQERPLRVTADAIRLLRALFAGDRGPFTLGTQTWSAEAYLRFPARPIPIYLGAMSPRMQQLIGSLADGGLPLLFPPEHYGEVAARVAAGAAAANRDPANVDLAACVWVSVAEDRNAAEAVLRHKIAYYAHAMSNDVLNRLGVDRSLTAAIAGQLQRDRRPDAAAALVNPELLQIGIVGDGAELRARLAGLVAQGARHLSFGPPLGPDPPTAIEIIGREVIAHFA